MKKTLILSLIAGLTLSLTGCTENVRARAWGGSARVEGMPGKKVVNVTWKNADMWILYRDRQPGETPTTLIFQENSSFGIMTGTVTIVEK